MNTPWSFLDSYRDRFAGRWPSLPVMFGITRDRFPDNDCFIVFDPEPLRLSYAEAHEKIVAAASNLVADGAKPGDRIGVTGKNSPEWAIAYLAVLFAGGTVVPIDYTLKEKEISNLLSFSETKILFTDEEKHDGFSVGAGSLTRKYSLSPKKPGYILDLAPTGASLPPPPLEEDLAAILFTSGTTGTPKGVMLSHGNLVSDCYLAQSQLEVLPTDVFYALLPLHHSYTMQAVFIESMGAGSAVVFGKKMVSQQILSDLKRGKVTMFLGVPMLFNRLIKGFRNGVREKGAFAYGLIKTLMALSGFLKKTFGVNIGRKLFGSILEKLSMDRIRICISGGGPLPSSTFRQFNQLGVDFVQGYGLTETSPIVTLNPIHHYKEDSVGKVIDGVEVKISDPDGEGNGEILVRGPIVMQGYYRNPEATAEIMTADGYLKTGDVGHLDGENYLYLTGRKKTLIVTEGGKNVFPEEIEDKFQLYEEVEQIMVRGYLADAETKAEGIEALVYPSGEFTERAGGSAAVRERIEAIVDEVNRDLPMYKRIGRTVVLDEAMEMTTTKKIKRFTVTAE